MLTSKRIGSAIVATLVVGLGLAPAAHAFTNSDQPAAVVVYPRIDVNVANGRDTVVQLTNANATKAVTAKCFYINANSHCTNTGAVCQTSSTCANGSFGSCVPGWTVTDFVINLTPRQPLGWSASDGLSGSGFPLSTRVCSNNPLIACTSDAQCPGGTCLTNATNSGSLIPPVPESPFVGELHCVEVDRSTGLPPAGAANTNDLKGEATVETILADGTLDVATANAVGLRSNGTTAGDSTTLTLGPNGDYQGCSAVTVVNHLFDGAIDPIDNVSVADTELTLVPCSVDLSGADPTLATSTAQFLVFNEFEQRFSTSHRVNCFYQSSLSRIDTTQPERSIWSAGVSGTVAGQTRIRAIGASLIAVARLNLTAGPSPAPCDRLTADPCGSSAYNVHQDSVDATNTIIIP